MIFLKPSESAVDSGQKRLLGAHGNLFCHSQKVQGHRECCSSVAHLAASTGTVTASWILRVHIH